MEVNGVITYTGVNYPTTKIAVPDYWRFYEDPLWLAQNGFNPMGSVVVSLPFNFPDGPTTNA